MSLQKSMKAVVYQGNCAPPTIYNRVTNIWKGLSKSPLKNDLGPKLSTQMMLSSR